MRSDKKEEGIPLIDHNDGCGLEEIPYSFDQHIHFAHG
jgi:hypothetical protein